MDWWQVTSIVLGSGLLSGLITTLLTQFHQRKENRYDPRREAYAELLASLDAFKRDAETVREQAKMDHQILLGELMEVLHEGSPLDEPLAKVRLLASNRTVAAAEKAAVDSYSFFLRQADHLELQANYKKLVASMRKDLGSVA